MKNLILILIFLTSNISFAFENFYGGYGVGISEPGKNSIAETKMLFAGVQRELGLADFKLEGGFWIDSRSELDRISSGYGSLSFGIDPYFEHFYIQSFWGAAYLTKGDDSVLSGHFQFMHDFGIGVKGSNNTGIGIFYKHISNAGIKSPNRGRDFIGIKLHIFNY